MRILFLIFLIILIQGFSSGCAPVNEVAGKMTDDLGEVSDELGKEQVVGKGDDTLTIHPQGDKKIKMNF